MRETDAGLLVSGQRITDGLVVERRLGEGAHAEVYRVRHHILGRQALKLFKNVASLEATSALLDEARILSTLGHPNIIRVFDAGTVQTSEGARGYITMEYAAGGSLERLFDAHAGAVPVADVVSVVRQTAEGLALAHERSRPLVHRDLSLANILITYDETGLRVKVSDFGLAKETDPVTMAASAQGTLAYMPPEVLRSGSGYSCAGDVWALGTVAYYLLTSSFPYNGGDPVGSFSLERFNRPLAAPSLSNSAVGADLDRLVADMLRIDPTERPATARDVAQRVRKLAAPVDEPGESRAVAASPESRQSVDVIVRYALRVSREPGRLTEAADLLEEAISRDPALRKHQLNRLTTWRRGVVM